jgi:hypothetical protein
MRCPSMGEPREVVSFMYRPDKQIGWPTLAGLGLVVVAFMALSLCVTAIGTARFAVGMGYDGNVGYAVGAIFDLAKGMLPIGLLALWWRRACGTAAFLGIAWLCLLFYSCLATHATVSTAISAIERTGTWKMEVRGNAKVEARQNRARGLGRRARALWYLEGQQ